MAAGKYITINGNQEVLTSAKDVSAGPADAGALVALSSTGFLDSTFFPTGIGETSQTFTFSEAVAAGALVDLSGTQARNADASTQRSAMGFVLTAVASGASGKVYMSGLISGLTGLTFGARYFLGAAGGVALNAPTAAGSIIQPIGRAVSTTSIEFNPDPSPILIA